MRKILALLSFLLLIPGIALLSNNVGAQNTNDFTIISFNAFYDLSKNQQNIAQYDVNEYITAEFPAYDQNHGIVRALPKIYNKNDLGLKINSVDNAVSSQTKSTQSWSYTSSTSNNNLVLKIGSASAYVHGQQIFHISYNMSNVIQKYPDHDELFWNVNGTQWSQSMAGVTANITLTSDLAKDINNKVCYTGSYGSTSQNCTIAIADNSVNVKSTAPLAAGENLSFALSFPPNTFNVKKMTFFDKYKSYIIAATAALIIIFASLIFMINKWRKFGKDPKGRGTIIAQYTPPKDTSVLDNAYVLDETLKPKAITAQLLNLATRGYVKIIDDSGKDKAKISDLSLQIVKDYSDLQPEEFQTLQLFFGDTPEVNVVVKVNDIKNSHKESENLANACAEKCTSDGLFSQNPQKITKKYRTIGSVIIFVGFGSLFFIGSWGLSAIIVLGGLIAAGAIITTFASYMPARSLKGTELNDYLLGLKLYIGTAEKDRIKFFQSFDNAERTMYDPKTKSDQIKLFEKLLPYAIIFGQEKSWAAQFETLYTSPPDWYYGNFAAFNTMYLLGSIGTFETFSTTTFSAPSSGGGSGFSGGFSGGGGGGGGGGGW